MPEFAQQFTLLTSGTRMYILTSKASVNPPREPQRHEHMGPDPQEPDTGDFREALHEQGTLQCEAQHRKPHTATYTPDGCLR